MEDVLPLEAYLSTIETTYTWRLALSMSVLWGIPMLLFTLWMTSGSVGLVFPLGIMGLASFGFGFIWTRLMRSMMRKLVRRLYEADPALVPPPPAGEFRCRLMCSLLVSRIAVGGHLYAGPAAWIFVPHMKNLKQHRDATALWTSGELQLTTKPAPMRNIARVLGVPPSVTLELNSEERVASLQMPEAERVAARLRQCGNAAVTVTR